VEDIVVIAREEGILAFWEDSVEMCGCLHKGRDSITRI
jgi:hypothetical protein